MSLSRILWQKPFEITSSAEIHLKIFIPIKVAADGSDRLKRSSLSWSACAICDPLTQCGLDLYVKEGKVIKVDGSKEQK